MKTIWAFRGTTRKVKLGCSSGTAFLQHREKSKTKIQAARRQERRGNPVKNAGAGGVRAAERKRKGKKDSGWSGAREGARSPSGALTRRAEFRSPGRWSPRAGPAARSTRRRELSCSTS